MVLRAARRGHRRSSRSRGWPGIVAANVLNLSAIFLVQGALVRAVDDVRDGRRDLGVAETLRHAGGRLVVLAVAGAARGARRSSSG